MQSLEEKLKNILHKFSTLEKEHLQLKNEHQAIKQENLKLKSDIYNKTEEINILKERFDSFKRKNVAGNDELGALDSDKMRTEIMHYIREVDKCLEWLNKY
jgi:chromosome segregation ATPase